MSLDYVMIGSNDVAKAREFYDAVMPLIGASVEAEYMPYAVCYKLRGNGRVWVALPYDENAAMPGNGAMLGIKCENQAEVRAAHEMALSKGGVNEGDPGPRPKYGPDFYGAYVRDLDGNKMSFVIY